MDRGIVRVQCKTCGAVYDTVLRDGLEYYHQCAPLSRAELAAAVKRGAVTLEAGEDVDTAFEQRAYERANARNENVPSTRAADNGRLTAAGRGVEVLAAASTPARVIVP